MLGQGQHDCKETIRASSRKGWREILELKSLCGIRYNRVNILRTIFLSTLTSQVGGIHKCL